MRSDIGRGPMLIKNIFDVTVGVVKDQLFLTSVLDRCLVWFTTSVLFLISILILISNNIFTVSHIV